MLLTPVSAVTPPTENKNPPSPSVSSFTSPPPYPALTQTAMKRNSHSPSQTSTQTPGAPTLNYHDFPSLRYVPPPVRTVAIPGVGLTTGPCFVDLPPPPSVPLIHTAPPPPVWLPARRSWCSPEYTCRPRPEPLFAGYVQSKPRPQLITTVPTRHSVDEGSSPVSIVTISSCPSSASLSSCPGTESSSRRSGDSSNDA
ncbi:hypothetical protein BJ742DRAFT_798349 [Cladochytrium replicatum]|nr:hypothetical protein BJ742DRAFT_798349 [Cladochytrium replicatum]